VGVEDQPASARGQEPVSLQYDPAVGSETSRGALLTYHIEFALRYCTVIFFGRTVSRKLAEMNKAGTGTLLRIGRRKFIVTNDHVLEAYERYCKTVPDTHFQVGRAMVDPHQRLIDRNKTHDICTMDADGLDLNDRLPSDPIPPLEFYQALQWPPARPSAGDVLVWAGFPKSLREIEGNTVFNGPLGFASAPVTRLDGYRIISNMNPDRTDLIIHYGNGLDSQSEALKELGGMSGGPVFVDRKAALRPELIGLISEYHRTVNQMRISRIDALRDDGSIIKESLE
jgi:hypothetical protein